MIGQSHLDSRKRIAISRIALIVEVLLTFAICTSILAMGILSLKNSAERTVIEVDSDYSMMIDGYITTFNNLSLMAEEKIQEDYSFEEMLAWLQGMHADFEENIGSDIFDGFAFTYKGGYVRSWSYGEYSDYVPASRPWYQSAQEGNGEVVVVAPYVTFLDPSYLSSDEYIILTIARKYNDEICFDYDIKIKGIQKLLSERDYAYDGTRVLLYDRSGYILSSNNTAEFSHNVYTTDGIISESTRAAVEASENQKAGLMLKEVDGTWQILYGRQDSGGNMFCIMYPLWQVFHNNFLAIILITLLLLTLEIYLYCNNMRGILAFQQNESQLSGVLEAAFEDVLYVDLESMTFSRNAKFEALIGNRDYQAGYHALLYLAADDEVKENLHDFLSPEIIRQQTVFDGNMTSRNFTLKYHDKEEEKLQVLEFYKMFFKMGRKKVMTLLSNDVTEDVTILKKALADAEIANQAKTDFLSRMSHDIRTPMNAIIGLTHLAKAEDRMPVIKQYLNNIDTSSTFLLGLINDILDFSKIESGELELKPEPYSILDFENSVQTVIGPLMQSRNIHFVIDLNCGASWIMVDKLRFSQIFFNLLSNAAKYTPAGGTVEFRAEPIAPRGDCYGIRYVVQDNGCGISEEFLLHMFEPFSQERINENADVTGTGLGLPIAKSLVDAMGGTIEVISKLGEGTKFHIDLYTPLAEKVQETPQEVMPDISLENREILVAEDNDMNILVAQNLLENEGCHVTVAKNGKQAVECFAASGEYFFDAILMDMRMPVMNGIEATREIRSLLRADAKTIPIIAMTADAFVEEQKKTLEAGMNYHLSKPIEPKLFYRVLKEYIEKYYTTRNGDGYAGDKCAQKE